MNILVIRHAKAAPYGRSTSDSERPLIDKGVRQCGKIASFLAGTECRPDIVLTSPVLRARQTAEHVCEQMGSADLVSVVSWLACGMRPEEAMAELVVYQEFENVAIVGHEPDLSSFISHVLGMQQGYVHVGKGSVTLLEEVRPPAASGCLRFAIPNNLL